MVQLLLLSFTTNENNIKVHYEEYTHEKALGLASAIITGMKVLGVLDS